MGEGTGSPGITIHGITGIQAKLHSHNMQRKEAEMMKKKPVLVIMAAGMGSRYGGLKQIDPIDGHGNLIIDFSIYDAVEAGFEKVIFLIKKSIEKEFREQIGSRMEKHVETVYAYQELDRLPEGYVCPEGRVKPWGTGHAVLCCAEELQGAPFAVINADDYYGKSAFRTIFNQLSHMEDDEKHHYTMVGYDLYKTLTEHGHVARGVCTVNEDGMLREIVERTRIEKHGDLAEYTEDDGACWTALPKGTIVSMNLWGFTPSILEELGNRFPPFLDSSLKSNPLKSEYFLPFVVDQLIREGRADVKVLHSADSWYGVTYREDKERVVKAVRGFKEAGMYPENLWEES